MADRPGFRVIGVPRPQIRVIPALKGIYNVIFKLKVYFGVFVDTKKLELKIVYDSRVHEGRSQLVSISQHYYKSTLTISIYKMY